MIVLTTMNVLNVVLMDAVNVHLPIIWIQILNNVKNALILCHFVNLVLQALFVQAVKIKYQLYKITNALVTNKTIGYQIHQAPVNVMDTSHKEEVVRLAKNFYLDVLLVKWKNQEGQSLIVLN